MVRAFSHLSSFDIFTTELKYGRISTTVFSNRISLPNYLREGLDVVILVTQRLNLQILPFPSVNTADPSLWCFFTTMQLGKKKETKHEQFIESGLKNHKKNFAQ